MDQIMMKMNHALVQHLLEVMMDILIPFLTIIVILILPTSPILRDIMNIVAKEKVYGINRGINIVTFKMRPWESGDETIHGEDNITISKIIIIPPFPRTLHNFHLLPPLASLALVLWIVRTRCCSASASYPYPSYHDAPPAPSYDDPRGLPSSSPPSSTTFLMRTNALLSQLNNTDPQPNNFNNLPPEEGQNKRVKHDHSFDPYASSPSYSSALSSVPTTAPSSAVNGYSSHRSHDYTSPLGSNYSNGSRIDTTPVTNFPVSVSSSSSFPSTGSRVPLSSSTGILSRTEQLLAETSSSYTRPCCPSSSSCCCFVSSNALTNRADPSHDFQPLFFSFYP